MCVCARIKYIRRQITKWETSQQLRSLSTNWENIQSFGKQLQHSGLESFTFPRCPPACFIKLAQCIPLVSTYHNTEIKTSTYEILLSIQRVCFRVVVFLLVQLGTTRSLVHGFLWIQLSIFISYFLYELDEPKMIPNDISVKLISRFCSSLNQTGHLDQCVQFVLSFLSVSIPQLFIGPKFFGTDCTLCILEAFFFCLRVLDSFLFVFVPSQLHPPLLKFASKWLLFQHSLHLVDFFTFQPTIIRSYSKFHCLHIQLIFFRHCPQDTVWWIFDVVWAAIFNASLVALELPSRYASINKSHSFHSIFTERSILY